MLTVAKVTSGQAQGYAAYLDGRTQKAELGDYYLKDGMRVEAPGRWAGDAEAVAADPSRPVTSEQLHALMAVENPSTGLPLRRVGGNGEAVCAIDATFSAPKSVSAVWALGSLQLRAQIEAAHERAVDRALTYTVDQVDMIRQRADNRVDHVKAAGLVATSWRHTTARAVADQPPDPQLHSHVLLHAAVRKDGETVAIDSRSMLVHRREIAAAYRTHLAYELSQLGFQIERGTGRGGRYFELAGVPAALIDRWSSRHHQVQAAIRVRLTAKQTALEARVALGGPDAAVAVASLQTLKRSGQLMPGEDRYLASHTRTRKTPVTDGDLDRGWYHDGRDHEFDTRTTAQLHDGGPRPLQPATTLELLDRLTEFAATFTHREARAVALEANAGVTVEQALAALDQLQTAGELLLLTDGRLTTTRHRHLERRTVATAHRLAGTRVIPLSDELIARQALVLDAELQAHSAQLSGEQRRALEVGCADRPLVIIEGQAGTGKSTTLTAIARAHQTSGRRVIVTSTAALAAHRLATELKTAGVDATAYSTAALDARLAAGRLLLDERTTVIHDEAALASTHEHHQLLSAVEASEARVILVGDPRQSQAVGAGGLWQDLEHAARSNAAQVQLTRIVRARDPADRRDQALFRAGHTKRALRGYTTRGRIHLTTDQREAEDAALEAAHGDRLAGKRTLIVAQTSNEHLDELNARAQAIRNQDGQLGPNHLLVTGRPYRLRAGDEIQLRHQLTHPDLGLLSNGTTATVLHVDPDHQHATLQLSDGRTARFTRSQADEASVRLSYVQHPFPAQGHTSDTAHLIVAENATQEGCYVALTRARQNTHIHAPHPQPQGEQLTLDQPQDDPLTVLAEWMSRTEPEVASIRTPIAHEQHLYHQHTHEQHAENDPRRRLEDAVASSSTPAAWSPATRKPTATTTATHSKTSNTPSTTCRPTNATPTGSAPNTTP